MVMPFTRCSQRSLLCSGQEANIQLASQLLTSSLQTPSRSESQISKATHPSGFSYQLPYDKSVELSPIEVFCV